MRTKGKRHISGLAQEPNPSVLQAFSRPGLAESWASHSATPIGATLGIPLSIGEAAELIGCSAWTIRQTHLPNGLPYFRSGPNGKLIFYRDQVIAWILSQQRKGGR